MNNVQKRSQFSLARQFGRNGLRETSMQKNMSLWISRLFTSSTSDDRVETVHRGNILMVTKILPLLNLIMAVLLILLFPSQAQAAYYIRAGSSGTNSGSDWNNAYISVPATLIRGETYWIADGSYGSYTFNDPVSGSNYITIKKATISDHGTNIGWESIYGDGQAEFIDLKIETNYFIIDGNENAKYGIKINSSSTVAALQLLYAGHITIRGLEIDLIGAPSYAPSGRCILTKQGNDITLQHINAHHCLNDGISIGGYGAITNLTIDDMWLHDRRFYTQGSPIHGDAVEIWSTSSNVTIKNSVFDWNGQILFFGGDSSISNFYIYGNVFTGGSAAKGLHPHDTASGSGLYVYNNSFYNCGSTGMDLSSAFTGVAKNNVFYDVNGVGFGNLTHDYNYFETGNSHGEAHQQVGGNPFINAAGYNFKLSAATNGGDSSIGAVYGTDQVGKIRGGDGVWDRGAFEYIGSVSVDLIPSAPRVISVE